MDEILGPPHGRRLHQVSPEHPCPPEPQDLGGQYDDQGHQERHLPPIEDLNRANYVDRVDVPGTSVGEDGDQYVLLHVEGARIEGELPSLPREEDPPGEGGSQQVAEGDNGDLGRDGG